MGFGRISNRSGIGCARSVARRAARSLVVVAAASATIAAGGTLAPGVAGAQSAASAGPAGASSLEDSVRSGLGLIANGSAFNSDAPTLAPLSVGTAPLSAASEAGGTASAAVPLLMGATLAMSLVPVGSLANSAELAGLFFGPSALTNAAGSFTGGGYPAPVPDSSINTNKLVKREKVADKSPGNLEIWTVTSATMHREVKLEVYLPGNSAAAAPVLYLLEGVDTVMPTPFRDRTAIAQRAHDENVVAIAPSGAPGANWAEWEKDDPRLGRNKWNTFLGDELPGILAAQTIADQAVGEELTLNGKYGAIGMSMGAGSALRLATNNPGQFAAVGGVSGCYSTDDDLGYQTIRLNVETRGGNLDNMWGPRGSEAWKQNDVTANAGKLSGTHVFLSAATGAIGAEDARQYGNEPAVLFSGYILEAGARECTERLSRSLDSAGVEHENFYMPTGIHNWTAFGPGMDKAFDSVIPRLR